MPDATVPEPVRHSSYIEPSRSYSIREGIDLLRRRWRFLASLVGGFLLLCLLYCLIAPKNYEAAARVGLRMQPASTLTVDATEVAAPTTVMTTPLQLETLVNVLRSERLAWRVITELQLYNSPAFAPSFRERFPTFDAVKPSAEAQSYLLDRFAKRLKVRAIPRTLLIEIRFRSHDPALAARVANTLIRNYSAEESESRVEATSEASAWLTAQLKGITADVEAKEKHLSEFEREHGFTTTEQTMAGGQQTETLNDPNTQQIVESGRLLAEASGERILREALYAQARQGNPEQVLAANPAVQAEMGSSGASLAIQLRNRQSDAALELAQLKVEHGPKFPRVIELERIQTDLNTQIAAVDTDLVEGFRRSWVAAQDREQMLQRQLDERLAEGVKQNDATLEYTVLHEEVLSGRELANHIRQRIAEAGLSAGVHSSGITVVDWAREPSKPATPDPPLYLAITLFASIWLAIGSALLLDALETARMGGGA